MDNLDQMITSTMFRSFLAIEIPEDIRIKMYETFARLHRQAGSVKWLMPSHMHSTLCFLGEQEEQFLYQKICPVVYQIANEIPPFKLSLKGVGVFPSLNKPRIFWMGLEEEFLYLKLISGSLHRRLSLLDLPKDLKNKEFQLHVTLARIQGLAKLKVWQKALEEYEKIDLGSFVTSGIVLFKSEFKKEGMLYTPLYKFSFDHKVSENRTRTVRKSDTL